MAPWKQSCSCSVGSHGLLRLILGCKGVSKSNPARCKVLVEVICLLEVLPSLGVFLNHKVIAANCVPRNRRVGVGTYQFVRKVVEFSLQLLLDEHAAKKRHHFDVVGVFIHDFSQDLISRPKLLLTHEMLGLNKPYLEGVLFCQKLNYRHLHDVDSLLFIRKRRCYMHFLFWRSQTFSVVVSFKRSFNSYRTYSVVF